MADERYFQELTSIVGDEWVQRDLDDVEEYRDPFRLATDDTGPLAVVSPSGVEEVQAIMRLSARFGVAVWPGSQSRNYGYGASEPRRSDSIILSLRRMNRVLDIDEASGTVLIEPGVTFFDLYNALRAAGSRLWLSVPDLGWGSVVANSLEYGLGYTPYGEHANNLCGLEVVMPDGDVMRTGMGAASASRVWNAHKRGFGPTLDGLFMQSNLGVVTKAGVWLMPEPEVYIAGDLMLPRGEHLPQLLDTLRPLIQDRTLNGLPTILHGFAAAAMTLDRDAWLPLEHDDLQAAIDDNRETVGPWTPLGIGMWNMRFALYGRERVVPETQRIVEEALRSVPGARIRTQRYETPLTRENVPIADQVRAGIPKLDDVLAMLDRWGGVGRGGHVSFSPVSRFDGQEAQDLYRRVWDRSAKAGQTAIYSIIARERSLIHVDMMMYDVGVPEQVRRGYGLVGDLIADLGKDGFVEYRAHQSVADEVAGTFDFNDHAYARTVGKLKQALDPAGILAPGKQGIWPAKDRP